MTVYADASLVVAAYTVEAMSEAARQALAELGAGELSTSGWCETEIASALATKARTQQISPSARAVAAVAISDMLRQSAIVIEVTARHFAAAAALLERSALPLRGGDALHLAIAADRGAALWTLDRRMAAAGEALGLDTRLIA